MGRLPVSGPRVRVAILAIALFGAIFVARMATGEIGNGITLLYVVPIVIAAVSLGRTAGILAGLLGLVLFATWSALQDPGLGLLAYASRGIAYLLVGAITGHMADRVRAAAGEAEAAGRHFELSSDMLCTASFEGRLLSASESWQRTLGWTFEELTSRPFIEFVHPDDREASMREFALSAQGERAASFVNRCRTKDGRWLSIEWTSQADPDRKVIYAAARNVTERHLAEDARREAEERFRRAFEDSATGMALVEVQGSTLLAVNASLARMLGRRRDQLVGIGTLAELVDPEDAPRIAKGLARLEAGDAPLFHSELRIVRPDGRRVWVDLTTSVVRDEQGEPLYRLSQLVDIDSRRRAEEQLQYLADHDPLSGVYNRRRFERELQRELGYAAMRRSRGALLVLDVDNFKAINDALGHAAGDKVIARLGATLTERMRSGDVIGRLGGDEFAVLLRRVDLDEARQVATSVRALAIERLADVTEQEQNEVTLSVGVATFGGDDDGDTPSMDQLFRRADAAMYTAKRAGGNQVAIGA
jgi:diguanylate cyclase (GGDEF)-like protein/PAS domain S-box-containing protein